MAETQYKYVAAYGQLGDGRKAREHWDRCAELEPNWSSMRVVEILRLWNFEESYIEAYMLGIVKAGFPFARRKISWTRALISGRGAKSTAGSRFP